MVVCCGRLVIADLARISRDLRVVPNAEIWARQESIAQHPERSSSAFNPLVDLITKRCKVNGLGQKRLCTALQSLALCLGITIGSDHYNRNVGPRQQLQTAHPWHVDVG